MVIIKTTEIFCFFFISWKISLLSANCCDCWIFYPHLLQASWVLFGLRGLDCVSWQTITCCGRMTGVLILSHWRLMILKSDDSSAWLCVCLCIITGWYSRIGWDIFGEHHWCGVDGRSERSRPGQNQEARNGDCWDHNSRKWRPQRSPSVQFVKGVMFIHWPSSIYTNIIDAFIRDWAAGCFVH